MQILKLIVALMIWLISMLKAPLFSQSTSSKLDSLVNAYAGLQRFSGSVLVFRHDSILLNNGYGYKDAAGNSSNNNESVYQVYSVTKTFTSTMILKLVEMGKMKLDDKLSRFYPQIPASDSITIVHLLSHRSGLYEYTRGNSIQDWSDKGFVDFISKQPLDFSPGSSWSYSNTGYWMLGFIISKVTRMSYEEAIGTYIFKPLGMNHSGFNYKALRSADKTIGYEIYKAGKKKPAEIYESPHPYAAGAIWSTPADLLLFHKALQQKEILGQDLQHKAYTNNKDNYGYGWMLDSIVGKKIVKHSGGAAGYRSVFIRIPEDDICVVVFSNTENDVNRISSQILNILYGLPYKIPFHNSLAIEKLRQYEGTYQLPNNLFLFVEAVDDVLVIQPNGQPASSLFTEGDNSFYVEEIDGKVSFSLNGGGHADTLLLIQRGSLFKAPRIDATWGITGSATTNGWEGPDIKLIKQKNSSLWTANNIVLKDGEIKFRFNDDWTQNIGGSEEQIEFNGGNITVKQGVYDISLDLNDKDRLKFRMAQVKKK